MDSGSVQEEEFSVHEFQKNFNPKKFLECSECASLVQIQELERRMDIADSRFGRIETELMSTKTDLKDNSKMTTENNDILNKVHDGLFVDSADRQSMQSSHLILNQKVSTLWSIVIFLIISIAGIAFTVIQKSMEVPPAKETQTSMNTYYLPQRDDRSQGSVIKPGRGK